MTSAEPSQTIRILLTDDHAVVRQGLVLLLGIEPGFTIIGEAEDAAEALEMFRRERPDIVIMDVRMPGEDGIHALEMILIEDPTARVLMLSSYDLDEDLFRAFDAGAAGYVPKTVKHDELFEAIRRVHAGKRWMPDVFKTRLENRDTRSRLSLRETETLDLLARGFTNREIGTALGITERTAKAHVLAIFAKLEAADRAEAVTAAYRKGLLKVEGH